MDATTSHFSSLMRRFQKGDLSAEQAIREAARIRQPSDIVPQLQANFAFSKAYVAESSGTRGGLRGASFFGRPDDFRHTDTTLGRKRKDGEMVK
jgi:hypothetical protein